MREPADLAGLSGLILPGGESTTMRLGIERWRLRDPIELVKQALVDQGTMPTGEIDSLELLDAERTYAEREADLSAVRGVLVSTQIDLFRSLGGGWDRPQKNIPGTNKV